jgi:GAG-pre-integrase domain
MLRLQDTPAHLSSPYLWCWGACVYAAGLGTVELCVATGHKIVMENILYVPASTVCLISVLTLNCSGRYTSHFNSFFCWVTNPGSATILCGIVYENCCLYGLSLSSACTTHVKPPKDSANILEQPQNVTTHSALYASRTPDIETWHRRLGHCHHMAIINMAQRGAIKGMAIDLSSTLLKCNHCILGKQTRSSVPKVQEGVRASRL